MSSSKTVDQWVEKAEENVDEHGLESPGQLTLLMAEELGEIADALVKASSDTDRNPEEREAMSKLRRVSLVGSGIQAFCERTMDGDYNPEFLGEIEDPEEVRQELEDLAALCVQMSDALSECE